MARKTKEEALTTRAHIIDAARRVFHAEGVNRSTLDKVAQAAGVTRGAVYWHFANKTELFLAVKQTYRLYSRNSVMSHSGNRQISTESER